jgi:ferredoxin
VNNKKEATMSRVVYIDDEECIACGSCEEICPEVFKLNEETE